MDITVSKSVKLPVEVEGTDSDDVYMHSPDGDYCIVDRDGDTVGRFRDFDVASEIASRINSELEFASELVVHSCT